MSLSETVEISNAVCKTMDKICARVSLLLDVEMDAKIAGSFAEGTKCFSPNEFDFTFTLKNDELSVHRNIARRVYLAMEHLLFFKEIISLDSRLQVQAVLHENRIAKLRMLWNGEVYKNFVIFVDVAVCDEFDVAKYSRHLRNEINQTQESFHKQEQRMIRELQPFQRNGFILAKAVRIASISKPDDVIALDLIEDIYADSVISSFVLKACLFDKKGIKTEFQGRHTPSDVAIKIYEILLFGLEQRLVESAYTGERPVYCKTCRVERGCCKKRKFMKAMVEKILTWLQGNKDWLHTVQF